MRTDVPYHVFICAIVLSVLLLVDCQSPRVYVSYGRLGPQGCFSGGLSVPRDILMDGCQSPQRCLNGRARFNCFCKPCSVLLCVQPRLDNPNTGVSCPIGLSPTLTKGVTIPVRWIYVLKLIYLNTTLSVLLFLLFKMISITITITFHTYRLPLAKRSFTFGLYVSQIWLSCNVSVVLASVCCND